MDKNTIEALCGAFIVTSMTICFVYFIIAVNASHTDGLNKCAKEHNVYRCEIVYQPKETPDE